MFVAKYGTDGTLVWAKQAEANGWVTAVDGSGNSYITGVFAGTDLRRTTSHQYRYK